MPIIEGTTSPKSVIAEYDFAVDGGAVSAITLRGVDSLGNNVPTGAVITSGYLDVLTTCTSGGSATVALSLEGAADLLTTGSGAVANLTAGRKTVIPVATGATAVKTTVPRSIVATIATAALTAGKFRVVLYYV